MNRTVIRMILVIIAILALGHGFGPGMEWHRIHATVLGGGLLGYLART